MKSQKNLCAHGMSSFTKLCQYTKPNAAMVILELKNFLIPWKILLLNLFSVSLLCYLEQKGGGMKNI